MLQRSAPRPCQPQLYGILARSGGLMFTGRHPLAADAVWRRIVVPSECFRALPSQPALVKSCVLVLVVTLSEADDIFCLGEPWRPSAVVIRGAITVLFGVFDQAPFAVCAYFAACLIVFLQENTKTTQHRACVFFVARAHTAPVAARRIQQAVESDRNLCFVP